VYVCAQLVQDNSAVIISLVLQFHHDVLMLATCFHML